MGIYGESININSPTFRRLTDDAPILTQALEMRLSTAAGTYADEPEYGLDLSDLQLEHATPATVARLGLRIAAQLEQDERVESASVRPSTTPAGAGVKFQFFADVTPRTGEPLSLVISVKDLSIEVLLRGA